MLHDVGKLGVPTRVLQKSGRLTEEEFAAVQLHPMRGLEIVREIDFLDEALAGIMHHHERIDGRGYPLGLAGDEIPEFARVIAVADAFDSMTSDPLLPRRAERRRGHRRAAQVVGEPVRPRPGRRVRGRAASGRAGSGPSRVAPPPPGSAEGVPTQDHDDPTAPLRVESR